MDAIAHLPANIEIKPPLEGHWLVPVYAGEVMVMLFDLRYVSFTLPPVEPPPPPPDPTPPPTVEYFKVIVDSLNVRVLPNTIAKIVAKLKRGDEVRLVGAITETPNYQWRQTDTELGGGV